MNNFDDELANLLAKDLETAFWYLVQRYQNRLYTFALRLTRNSQDAEDIVQDALLGAYMTLAQYPSERIMVLHIRSWLYKVVLNVFRNSKRNQHIQWQSIDEMFGETTKEDPDWEPPDEEQPEQYVERLERREELEAVLMQLPIYYRIIVTCYYFEELSYQEIAELTDQPLGTVKSRLHRGLHQIRQYMQATQQERRSSYGFQ